MRRSTAILLLAADAQSLLLPTTRSVRTAGTPRMGLLPEGSLGGKMLKTVTDLFDNGDEDAAPAPESDSDTPKGSRLLPKKNTALEDAVSDIDSRAAEGDITFRDFLTMSKTISGMGEDMSALPPGLSATQILELRAKVTKHEKIVEVMMEDEKDDPELLMEDLKAGGSTPGPRMQRLATASGETEQEVGLFLMQFEAMRESTRRIADGEDPDEVNESLSAPPGANRQARRVAEKKKAKAAKKKNKM